MVNFTSTLVSKFVPAVNVGSDIIAAEMATDIHKRAVMLAPVESGNLANSGKIERISIGVWRVIFGSSRVPYARRRHFENMKNPQTLKYLERAGDSVARGNVDKYFRGK